MTREILTHPIETYLQMADRPKTAKYRNQRVEVDGIAFASKKEARRYAELKLLERAGEICALQLQVRYPLKVLGQLVTTYVADFQYVDADGLVVEDVKGFRTDLYKVKAKLFKAVVGFPIREV